MKLDLTGRQIEITEGLQEFVERKVKKFDKFLININFFNDYRA